MTPTDYVIETFGEPISVYTRQQAIEDGALVDVTEWASADKGFLGGFACPVVVTRALWEAIGHKTINQDTRGRAHDVLFMASLAARRALAHNQEDASFTVHLRRGHIIKQRLYLVMDGDGVTVGFPDDF